MFVRVGGTLDEDEARLAEAGGFVEFTVGGRKAFRVLPPVLVAQQCQIDVAAAHFFQVNGVGPTVGRGNVLEQEDIKKRLSRASPKR